MITLFFLPRADVNGLWEILSFSGGLPGGKHRDNLGALSEVKTVRGIKRIAVKTP